MTTLRDLVALCRLKSLDTERPELWSDDQWAGALNHAEAEACIRARLIDDDSITSFASAGDPYVKIPARAFAVHRVSIDGRSIVLFTQDDLAASLRGAWETETGFPVACYRVNDKLRLYPIPRDDAEVKLSAFCTPKEPMELVDADVEPEIGGRLHVNLVDWALFCFYSAPDVDYTDSNLAGFHESQFTSTFGPRPDEVEVRRSALKARRSSRVRTC